MEFFLHSLAQDGGQAPGAIATFLPFILILLVFYFFMMRPQIKKQKEREPMLNSVKKGDDVITVGGVHGKVVGEKHSGKVLTIRISDKVEFDIDKTAVSHIKGVTDKDEK